MLSAILGSLLLGQTIPQSASVVYPCFPECEQDVSVRFLTHSAVLKITDDAVQMESLSTIKNTSNQRLRFDLVLPTRGSQARLNQAQAVSVSAWLDKVAVNVKKGPQVHTSPLNSRSQSGVWAGSYSRQDIISVPMEPGQTRSLKIQWQGAMGIAGMDGLQRMVIYDTSGAANWDGLVAQMNVAIQYEPNLILQVFAALPDKQWQVGEKGAFFKKYNYSPPKKPHLIFTYYPQKI